MLAHKDIHPTKEWQSKIENALFSMGRCTHVTLIFFSLINQRIQQFAGAYFQRPRDLDKQIEIRRTVSELQRRDIALGYTHSVGELPLGKSGRIPIPSEHRRHEGFCQIIFIIFAAHYLVEK